MKRILVVEDEKSIQNVIKAFLENEKYNVETADDGLEAINILQDHNYDLILLDLMLPKIDGYTVCEMIRKKSNVPIIILTALTDEESQIKGFDKLADDYITKPFSMPVVLKHIEALFRRIENKDNVILSIKDNGCGIKDSDLVRVFEKGFTGSDRTKSKSTGISLYLSKKICNKLGLEINIYSKHKEWTKVEIIYPKSNFNKMV